MPTPINRVSEIRERFYEEFTNEAQPIKNYDRKVRIFKDEMDSPSEVLSFFQEEFKSLISAAILEIEGRKRDLDPKLGEMDFANRGCNLGLDSAKEILNKLIEEK